MWTLNQLSRFSLIHTGSLLRSRRLQQHFRGRAGSNLIRWVCAGQSAERVFLRTPVLLWCNPFQIKHTAGQCANILCCMWNKNIHKLSLNLHEMTKKLLDGQLNPAATPDGPEPMALWDSTGKAELIVKGSSAEIHVLCWWMWYTCVCDRQRHQAEFGHE